MDTVKEIQEEKENFMWGINETEDDIDMLESN